MAVEETVCHTCIGNDFDTEELQLDYEEKCNDVAELHSDLRAAKLESQQLRIRLQAAAAKAAAKGNDIHTPCALPTPPPSACDQEGLRLSELRTIIAWLAQHVDLSEAEVLDVGAHVPIGGRIVHLQRVVQWKLKTAAGGQLRVSVPIEHHESIGGFLTAVKSAGNVPENDAVRRFADVWDLAPGELMTVTHSHSEPAVLLANRGSAHGILVASWPTRSSLEAFHMIHAVASGSAPLQVGEPVEVEYEGEWYPGTIHDQDCQPGQACVQCDADEPGLLTHASLLQIRRVGTPFRHAPASACLQQDLNVPPCSEPSDVVPGDALDSASNSDRAPVAEKAGQDQAAGSREYHHRRIRSAAM